MKFIKKLFYKWNKLEKCPMCKCSETKHTNLDYLNESILGEYDVVCAKCGTYINHFAYGNWEYLFTKTEEIKDIWCGRYYSCTIWQKIKWTWQTIWI